MSLFSILEISLEQDPLIERMFDQVNSKQKYHLSDKIFSLNHTFGTTSCIVEHRFVPHVPISIIKPFKHFNTNSVRFITQGMVISYSYFNQNKSKSSLFTSVISCVNNNGNVNVVISCLQHDFKIFLKPNNEA
jgi:hypothetical protein